MAKLIYSTIASLDGYVADEHGNFDWAAPDEEVHAFVNDIERHIGTYLYGRRIYETMLFWETANSLVDPPPVISDYTSIWQASDKIVYSRTLTAPASARTRLERHFDPEKVEGLKSTTERDISIGGPHLAATALAAGLVDEVHLFLVPHVIGGGTRSLPNGVRFGLELLDERRFTNGTVHLHYRTKA